MRVPGPARCWIRRSPRSRARSWSAVSWSWNAAWRWASCRRPRCTRPCKTWTYSSLLMVLCSVCVDELSVFGGLALARLGDALVVLRPIEADLFVRVLDAHREDPVRDLVEDEGASEREDPDDHQRCEVMEEGRRAPVDEAYFVGEDAGGQHAHDAAHAMAGEDVEGVVDLRLRAPA